jgi:hypothetical protein
LGSGTPGNGAAPLTGFRPSSAGRSLGDCRKIVYQIAQGFRSPSSSTGGATWAGETVQPLPKASGRPACSIRRAERACHRSKA